MQKHVFFALSPASKFRVVRKETRMSPEITWRNGVGRTLIVTHYFFFRETFTRRFSGDGLQLLFCLNIRREKISLFFIFLCILGVNKKSTAILSDCFLIIRYITSWRFIWNKVQKYILRKFLKDLQKLVNKTKTEQFKILSWPFHVPDIFFYFARYKSRWKV